MKKINFNRDEDGCFCNNNIEDYAVTPDVMMAAIVSEIQSGTRRKLHDVFADKALWIVVPITDEDGNTFFEKTKVIYVNDKEYPLGEGACPLAGGQMWDEQLRWWDIQDTDVAFTDEDDADKMEFFSNVKQILLKKADFLKTLSESTPVELFGEENMPPYEVVKLFAKEVLEDQIRTNLALQATDEIISEIGDDEEEDEEEENEESNEE